MARRSPPITPLPINIRRRAPRTGDDPRRPSAKAPTRAAPPVVHVFGGTFDPPHVYHLRVLPRLAEKLSPRGSLLLLVPAARNPLKAQAAVASEAHRIAMLREALRRHRGTGALRVAVWTDEIDRAAWLGERGTPKPSYTIDTLRRLRSLLPPATRVHLWIGSDQAAQFHRWRSARAIFRMARPFVLPRGDITTPAALAQALCAAGPWTQAEVSLWCQGMLPAPAREISSTRVRELLAQARGPRTTWPRELRQALPAPVAAYIAKHALYRASPPQTSQK